MPSRAITVDRRGRDLELRSPPLDRAAHWNRFRAQIERVISCDLDDLVGVFRLRRDGSAIPEGERVG